MFEFQIDSCFFTSLKVSATIKYRFLDLKHIKTATGDLSGQVQPVSKHRLCPQMSSSWEPSPRHMMRLDVRSLLQDAAIEEVRALPPQSRFNDAHFHQRDP